MADDMNTQSLCTGREHYMVEDKVLAHVEIPDPCEIRIDITADRVALTIGTRDFGWQRHHPDTTDSGTFLGDAGYDVTPQISSEEVRGIIQGAQDVIEGRTRPFSEIEAELHRKPAQSDAPSAHDFVYEWIGTHGFMGTSDYAKMCEAYAALRTAQLEAKYQNQILIANDWKNIATSNSSTLGKQSLLIDELSAKVAQLERELSELRKYLDANYPSCVHEGICDWAIAALENMDESAGQYSGQAGILKSKLEAAETALSEARERTIQEVIRICEKRAQQLQGHIDKYPEGTLTENAKSQKAEAKIIAEGLRALLTSSASAKGE